MSPQITPPCSYPFLFIVAAIILSQASLLLSSSSLLFFGSYLQKTSAFSSKHSSRSHTRTYSDLPLVPFFHLWPRAYLNISRLPSNVSLLSLKNTMFSANSPAWPDPFGEPVHHHGKQHEVHIWPLTPNPQCVKSLKKLFAKLQK